MKVDHRPIARGKDIPQVSDPVTCGEDLAYNARRAMELAPKFCGECEDYHLLLPVRRLANGVGGSGLDRDRSELIRRFAGLMANRRYHEGYAFDVVIAGAADTGILATCAHAAATNAGWGSVRFSVLDRCRTPLELCREYADRHKLPLVTEAVDFAKTSNVYSADLLVHHNLFQHVPRDQHVAILRRFGSWLKPTGRMIFAITIKPRSSKDSDDARRVARLDRIREKIDAGTIRINERAETFYARIARHLQSTSQRHSAFKTADSVHELFAMAGMKAESLEEFSRAEQRRIVAVLKAEGAA